MQTLSSALLIAETEKHNKNSTAHVICQYYYPEMKALNYCIFFTIFIILAIMPGQEVLADTGCLGVFTLPQVFSVTGTGTYCETGSGLPVGLSGSESGVIYHLYKNSVASGSSVQGTGSAISFGNQSSGTYTIKGTNLSGTIDMDGSAIINAASLPTANAGPDAFATAGIPYEFTGTGANNYTSVLWTKSGGNGTITNGTTLNPTYLQATSNSFIPIVFTLTVTGNLACPVATDQKNLYIFPASSNPLTWTGAVDNNWGLYMNWSATFVPGAVTDVTIPAGCANYPVVTGASLCRNLTIASGASILDNGQLTLKGTVTVQRSLPANEWHLISSPVANATSNIFLNQYLQTHTESTNLYTDIISTTAPLIPMKGYAIWGASGFTAQYTGALNTGSISIPLTSSGLGWNLVGNPYPSSINWDAISGWTKTNVNNATYVHVNSSTWATYAGGVGANGGTKYIAPGQGFFVRATGSGTLGMTNNVRVNNATTFFKSTSGDTTIPYLIRLQVSGNGYTDETVIRFLPEASEGFDENWDAYKLFGDVPGAAQIYTTEGTELAINSLHGVNVVSVGVRSGLEGEYTIAATEINDFTSILLEDTHTNDFTDLLKHSYTYNSIPGMDEHRFNLHFGPLTVEKTEQTPASIYSLRQTVFINLYELLDANIFVYNIAGQLITSKLSVSGMNEISLNTPGNYIVKIICRENTLVRKVFIQ